MESQFEGLVEAMRDFYNRLGIPYQFIVADAGSLSMAQSKNVRVTVRVHGNQEVVVGQVALYDDFISKRLMLMSSCDEKASQCSPLHIAAGTLVDATKMVGCLIEHFPHEWMNKIP